MFCGFRSVASGLSRSRGQGVMGAAIWGGVWWTLVLCCNLPLGYGIFWGFVVAKYTLGVDGRGGYAGPDFGC